MAGSATIFDETDADRILEAVRWVEAMRGPRQRQLVPAQHTPTSAAPVLVRCTSATPDGDGLFPGVVTWHDGLGWQDAELACKLRMAEGSQAISGKRYGARPTAHATSAAYVSDGGAWGLAEYDVSGVVSDAGQYLGAGEKAVDSLRLPLVAGTLATTDPKLLGSTAMTLGNGEYMTAGSYLEPHLQVNGNGDRMQAGIACHSVVVTTVPDQAFVLSAGQGISPKRSYLLFGSTPLGASSGAPQAFTGMGLTIVEAGSLPTSAPAMGGDHRAYLAVSGVVDAASPSGHFRAQGQDGVTATVSGLNFVGGIHVGGSLAAVTSVAIAAPASILSVSGSPVTGSGTLTLSLAAQDANTVWAGPTSGGAAAPTFRALVAADIPSHTHAAGDISSGTIATARLGSGTASSSTFLRGDQSWAAPPVDITGLSAAAPDLADSVPFHDASGSGNKKATLAALHALSAHTPGGRLSIVASGLRAHETTTSSSASTIYYHPFTSRYIVLYDGSAWTMCDFGTTCSIALSGMTGGKLYDVWAYLSSGTVTLGLSAAWTSDTARSESISYTDGFLVKDGDAAKRYLGTLRANGSNAVTWTQANRGICNAYNRLPISLARSDTSASWTYATGSYRYARGDSANKVEVVLGLPSDLVDLRLDVMASNSSAGAAWAYIGVDSTTGTYPAVQVNTTAGGIANGSCAYRDCPGVGYHYFSWLEYAGSAGTTTYYGRASGTYESGLKGFVWM